MQNALGLEMLGFLLQTSHSCIKNLKAKEYSGILLKCLDINYVL